MTLSLLLALFLSPQETKESWEARARELEATIRSADSADTVYMQDGRKLTGKIEEETSEYVRLKVRLGSMKFNRDDVAHVERSPGQEFLTKLGPARGKAADLQALMDWAGKNNFAPGREMAACLLLAFDPQHAAAKAVVAAAPADRDVVLLKDGTRKDGVIASESSDSIILDVILRGPKGETMGLGKAVVLKAEIQRIDRMPDGARAKTRERMAAFTDRGALLSAALARIQAVPATVEGKKGFTIDSDVFVLQTTVSEPLAKETAHALNQIFAAYQRHFAVHRNFGKKITVYFFSSREEYDGFQLAQFGGAVLNPAFYNPKANHIAAYNVVQSAEAENVRKLVVAKEQEIADFREKVNREEARIDKQVREIKAKLNDQVAQAKKDSRGDPKAEAEINRQKKAILDKLKSDEDDAKKELEGYRKKMSDAIEQNWQIVRENRAVLQKQGRQMYETLFHEAFHAFAANFLWAETDSARLPHWLHEGLATYYERSVVEAGELIHGSVDPALRTLAMNAPVLLEKIVTAGGQDFVVTHPNDVLRSTAHYASAWALAHYLVGKGTTRDQFEAYAQASRSGDPKKAFEVLAGKPLPQVDAEWRAWIAAMK